MTIRPANDDDLPKIVQLLKLSLGESLMPKSETFWRWKHIENPFGKSPVLLAFDKQRLIGVRAFMNWQWRNGEKIYKAVRAVDTATHPEFRGKGIFKSLTLQLVDESRDNNVDFIFNTPNKVSKVGYLKMGWASHGKMTIYVNPTWPFSQRSGDFDREYQVGTTFSVASENFISNHRHLVTNYSSEFLNWRYALNPNIKYHFFTDSLDRPSYLTIFRLKPLKRVLEFRVCENFISSNFASKPYTQHLKTVISESGANIVTSANSLHLFPSIRLRLGPEITVRPFTVDPDFLNFNFWKPSLGDLEVF